MELENNKLEWSAPEFDPSSSRSKVPMLLIAVFVAMITYALIENSPIMAITFVLLGTVTFLHSRAPIRTVSSAITDNGVRIGGQLYEFENIQSFWIIPDDRDRNLYLKTTGMLVSSVRIPLGFQPALPVRRALLDASVPEIKYEPTVIDTLSNFLHI